MNINWFPIFKGGKQTDSNGVEHDGNELIDKAVSSFDINKHERSEEHTSELQSH